jgi:hypothetical protein
LLLISGDAHSDSVVPGGARFVFVQPHDSGRASLAPDPMIRTGLGHRSRRER